MTINSPRSPLLSPQGGDAREVAKAVNLALTGKITSVDTVTLAAGAASTVVSDPRIGTETAVFLFPQTANAAAELGAGTLYIDPVTYVPKASYTITHANNAQTDRTFSLVILG